MGTQKTSTAPVADFSVLGVDDSDREAADKLSLARLAEKVKDCVSGHVDDSRHIGALVEIAQESLPNDTDCDKADAVLAVLPDKIRRQDNRAWQLGIYAESLLRRLAKNEASHG